jgi:polyisoprenoid-binding protein YceI
MKYIANALLISLFSFFPMVASAATWEIDPVHTTFQFSVRHMMVSNVKGVFHKFSGTFEIDDNDLTKTKASAIIDAASIDTGIDKRDEDLRSPNFFDVAKYPNMTFVSRKVEKVGSNYKMIGNLTIHGVTREVILDMEGLDTVIKDPWGNMRRGATFTTKINRKDFGLTYNKLLETGGLVVGDEVKINVEVELTRK